MVNPPSLLFCLLAAMAMPLAATGPSDECPIDVPSEVVRQIVPDHVLDEVSDQGSQFIQMSKAATHGAQALQANSKRQAPFSGVSKVRPMDCYVNNKPMQMVKGRDGFSLSALDVRDGHYTLVYDYPWDFVDGSYADLNACDINPFDEIIYCVMRADGKSFAVRMDNETVEFVAKLPNAVWSSGAFGYTGEYFVSMHGSELIIVPPIHELPGYTDRTHFKVKDYSDLKAKAPKGFWHTADAVVVQYPINGSTSEENYISLYGPKLQIASIVNGTVNKTWVKETRPARWDNVYGAGFNYKNNIFFSTNRGAGVYAIPLKDIDLDDESQVVNLDIVGLSDPTDFNDGLNCKNLPNPWAYDATTTPVPAESPSTTVPVIANCSVIDSSALSETYPCACGAATCQTGEICGASSSTCMAPTEAPAPVEEEPAEPEPTEAPVEAPTEAPATEAPAPEPVAAAPTLSPTLAPAPTPAPVVAAAAPDPGPPQPGAWRLLGLLLIPLILAVCCRGLHPPPAASMPAMGPLGKPPAAGMPAMGPPGKPNRYDPPRSNPEVLFAPSMFPPKGRYSGPASPQPPPRQSALASPQQPAKYPAPASPQQPARYPAPASPQSPSAQPPGSTFRTSPGVTEIDRVNASGQVVERDFIVGGAQQVGAAPFVTEIDRVNAQGQVFERDFVIGGGVPVVSSQSSPAVTEINRLSARGQVSERDFIVSGAQQVVAAPAVTEIDIVNARGQVVERDFIMGSAQTIASPPAVTEVDFVNAQGQVVERDFIVGGAQQVIGGSPIARPA